MKKDLKLLVLILKNVLDKLKNSISHIDHIESTRIKNVMKCKLFLPTDDFSQIKNVDAILICVPTPLFEKKIPDLSYILSSLNSIKKYLRKGQILVLESTTYQVLQMGS